MQINTIGDETFKTKKNFSPQQSLPELDGASSYLPVIGVDFKLTNNLSMMINQSLLVYSSNYDSNTQFTLRYHFGAKNKPQAPSYRKVKRSRSKAQIQELKEGVLLVRLKTSQPKIDALRKVGFEKKASKVEQYQLEQNKAILNAFKEKYDFSKVQFFYSYNSNNIRKGTFNGIFLNENLEVDSSIIIDSSTYIYTAELANIEQDTAKFLYDYHSSVDGNFTEKRTPMYYGGTNLSFKSIVVKDNQFNQLCRPFPYYSRYIGESIRRYPEQVLFFGAIIIPLISSYTLDQSVEKLNKKLYKYHNK